MFIRELDSECTARVITEFAKSGAFPGAMSGLSVGQQLDLTTIRVAHDDEGPADLRVLKTLAQHGLVSCVFDTQSHSEWQLTSGALQRLDLSLRLDSPTFMLKHCIAESDLKDCIPWELIVWIA